MRDFDEPRNPYRVPQRQWKRWTFVGRHVFNKTFHHMVKNPEMYLHPEYQAEVGTPSTKHFKTTAWNAAWMAADICSRGEGYFMSKMLKEMKGKV